MRRDDYRILCHACDLFDSLSEGRGSSKRKVIQLISDEQFLMALYHPVPSNGTSKDELSAKIAQIYNAASKRKAIEAIADALDDYGYNDMDRASATFLVTLVNLGMATIDAKASDAGRQKEHNEISERDFNRKMESLTDYQEELHDILDVATKIVRHEAKQLSRASGLPKEICRSALFTIPSPRYLDQFKIGFYLRAFLGNLYGFVNLNADELDIDWDDVDWNIFFSVAFSKQRIPDVASLLLLDNTGTKKYDNAYEVIRCQDSLSHFALKSLNKAPEGVRDQMIELYIKRLNKMISDTGFDLRIDLRMIDEWQYDKLAKTIKKYGGKLESILDRVSSKKKKDSDRPVVGLEE